MATKNTYFYAIGRRKTATARVRVMSGKGKITINDKSAEDYFAGSAMLLRDIEAAFRALEKTGEFDVTVKVSGGGQHGQAEAIQSGIAKALAGMNDDLKSTLRKAELLGRDPRAKERKKFGLKGARKQRQFTKR